MKVSIASPLLLLLFIAPGLAQEDAIRGRILPAPGENVLPEQMTITIRALRGYYVQTLPVHSSGNFSFAGVPAISGQYILELRAPNRSTVTETISVVAGSRGANGQITSATAPYVTLHAGRLLNADPPVGGQAVSAEWLKIPEAARRELAEADRKSAEGKHDEAVGHLKKALEISPDLYHAYNNLAVEYLSLEQPDKAIEALRKSIELEPDVASTHRNLGVIFLDAGDTKAALRHFGDALAKDPQDFESLMLQGEAHYGQGSVEQALKSFQAATRVAPANPEGHLYVGQCHLQLSQFKQAISCFEAFLQHGGDKDERAGQVRQLLARLKNQSN